MGRLARSSPRGVFSYAGGIIHPYYAVQLAPAIAALVAIGAVVLWRHRAALGARLTLAAGVAVTGVWSYELMARASDWHPWLRYAVLFVGAARRRGYRAFRRASSVGAAWRSPDWPGCSRSVADRRRTRPTPRPRRTPARYRRPGRPRPRPRAPPGRRSQPVRPAGQLGGPPSGNLGIGGFGSGAEGSSNSALAALLKATSTRWAAATVGDQSAASLELASGGKAVMAIGGWSGIRCDADACAIQGLCRRR